VGEAISVEHGERMLVRVLDAYRYRLFLERSKEVYVNLGLSRKTVIKKALA
jgi:hypothetical protein